MSPEAGRSCLAVDLGKTNCRVRLYELYSSTELRGSGFPGFASNTGVESALNAIIPLIVSLGTDRLTGVVALGLGAAGAESHPAAARECAVRLNEIWKFNVVVASDVLTAHVGALGGSPGTVLVAGTGAVAYHVGPTGSAERSDGWGPWLGDEGSGRWIGQAGLVSALRAADGRGPTTSLKEDARALALTLNDLPRAIAGDANVARSLASFAPTVLQRAAEGDDIAANIVENAVSHLAATAASVTTDGSPVSVIGGLADSNAFLQKLLSELHRRDLRSHRPLGTSLDGAAMLAERRNLPHERYAIRV